LVSTDFAKEVSGKLNAGLKLDEILGEADKREKLAEETEQLVKSYDSFNELFKLVRSNADRLIQSKATTEDEKNAITLQQQLSKYKALLNVKR
jgi:nitrogenase subunit NifH